jgi:protein-S-isoprenylcysteine O-methyltransferase Ste14
MPGMNEGAEPNQPKSAHLALIFPFVYQAVALICMRQWGGTHPWRELDLFSGGFFALTFLQLLYEIVFNRGILQSRETMREASGITYDPTTIKWGSLLAVADLSVFLDYGHWHLTLALRRPTLQAAGLALCACAATMLMWADTCLARHFQNGLKDRRLMTNGPFAVLRHPRYAALLLSKLSLALVFASVFGWASFLATVFLIRRRIGLEETHLLKIFGSGYRDYMQKTPGLIPRID